ncbi:MAG: hypothetical protein ACR2OO_16690 [Thermomicrobiales bacterium]
MTGAGSPVVVSGQALGVGGPVTDGSAFGGLDQARTVVYAQAGFGAGRYRQTVPIALTIPGQSQAGSYTATLTVSTTAAP